MKIETNEKLLVNVSVMGSVCQPNFQGLPAEPYRLDSEGSPFLLPTWGSIVHNVSVGAGLTATTSIDGSDKVTTFTAGTDTITFT